MTTKRRAADDGFSLSTPAPTRGPWADSGGGETVPGDRIVPVSTRIPERLHRDVKTLAASRGIKTEALFAEALADLLKKYGAAG